MELEAILNNSTLLPAGLLGAVTGVIFGAATKKNMFTGEATKRGSLIKYAALATWIIEGSITANTILGTPANAGAAGLGFALGYATGIAARAGFDYLMVIKDIFRYAGRDGD